MSTKLRIENNFIFVYFNVYSCVDFLKNVVIL